MGFAPAHSAIQDELVVGGVGGFGDRLGRGAGGSVVMADDIGLEGGLGIETPPVSESGENLIAGGYIGGDGSLPVAGDKLLSQFSAELLGSRPRGKLYS